MKAIILILISMFIFSGCDLKMGALFDRKVDYGPTWDDFGVYEYTAKVEVSMESGDPCTESYVYLIENSKNYSYSHSGGVFINIYLSFSDINPPEYKNYLCIIYMDQKEPPVFIEREISLKRGRDYPTFTVVFPDYL